MWRSSSVLCGVQYSICSLRCLPASRSYSSSLSYPASRTDLSISSSMRSRLCSSNGISTTWRSDWRLFRKYKCPFSFTSCYLLLMMTWCLPIVAPALAVWVRTLVTAGMTTPFDGDHFVGNVLVFMVLVYSMSHSKGRLFDRRHRYVVVHHRLYRFLFALCFMGN